MYSEHHTEQYEKLSEYQNDFNLIQSFNIFEKKCEKVQNNSSVK